MPQPVSPEEHREQLRWAAAVVARYGGPAHQATGEPVFARLPELAEALVWACLEGSPEDVASALPVADVLGVAWERLGEHGLGRARLDAMLASANRARVGEGAAVARVLRRRARLAMIAGIDTEAHEDLQSAYELVSAEDQGLTISIMLDRMDLATRRGDWPTATSLVPELLERTSSTGDPLIKAMGLNRSAWAVLGAGDLPMAEKRYQASWALVGLHEDPVVEARTASGLALLATLAGDATGARPYWRRALELAEQLHDRSFSLHCLDGIAALMSLDGEATEAARMRESVTTARVVLGHPREPTMAALEPLIGLPEDTTTWPYGEALVRARQAVTDRE